MLREPRRVFESVLRLVVAPVDAAAMDQAIDRSSFETLAAQEQREPFRERDPRQQRFFRVGKAGQWRDALPGAIVERIVADYGEVMKRHGCI